MKKIKFILLTTLLLITMSLTVYAEPSEESSPIPLGEIVFMGNICPSDLNAEVTFYIKNTTYNKTYSVYMDEGNNYRVNTGLVEFGDYEMVEGKVVVKNEKLKNNSYSVNVNPFTLDEENPNGDWTWYITVDVTPNTSNEETENILGVNNAKDDKTQTSQTSNDDRTNFTVPADNKYFPNMTLTEIKKWYIDEVNKFIANGGTTKHGLSFDLEYFKENLRFWAEWVYEDKENQVYSSYRANVEGYNTETTQEFYQVQKKIYDFVKEYEQENNAYLNFENWDKVAELEASTEPITSTDAEVTTDKQETTSSTETKETTTLEPTEPTTEDTSDNPSDKESFNFTTLIIIMSLVIIIIIVAVCIVLSRKKRA